MSSSSSSSIRATILALVLALTYGQVQTLALRNFFYKDISYVLGATLKPPGSCGPHRLTFWDIKVEALFDSGVNNRTTSGFFSLGIWKAPVSGFYQVCSSGRIKTGSQGDFTVNREPNPFNQVVGAHGGYDDVIAAFGSACPSRCQWSSHQICFVSLFYAGESMSVNLRSGDSHDCVEALEWPYTRLDILLIAATGNKVVYP